LSDFKAKRHQIRFRLALRPDPAGGDYSALLFTNLIYISASTRHTKLCLTIGSRFSISNF